MTNENDFIKRGDAMHIVEGWRVLEDDIEALPAAPTFTAADLERAWEMGRDVVQVVFLRPCGTVRVRRPKNPPADLAQRVKE